MTTHSPALEVAPGGADGSRQVAPVPPEPSRPQRRRRPRARMAPAILLIPSSLILIVVIGYPLLQLIIMSFQEFGREQVFGKPAPFIGLDNYVRVLTDPQFWAVLGRSVAFAAVNVVVTMLIGTLIALLLSKLNKGFKLLVSVGLLLAWAMPALTAVIVWGWMFDTQYGVVNYVLGLVTGQDLHGNSWLSNPLSFFMVATIIITWQSVPFVAFTIYAGLTQVPDEVLEAAQLDGANGPKRFMLVTFPYLKSIFLVVTVLQVIWDLRVFTQIYALQGIGGIREQTSTLGVYIYQTSLGTGDYGAGGAIAVIMVIIMMAISLYYVRQSIKDEEL